jgi:glycine betaine/proline transport system substrate-binding protein
MKVAKLLVGVAASMVLGANASARAEEAPGKVVMGQIGLSFYAVTAGVVQEVLERLGHTVEVTQGSHGQIFPRLGAGEVDLLVAAWLPHGHAVYWEQYGARAEELAVLYQGARFAWMVPSYVPKSTVADVNDLKKPEVLARMQKDIRGTGRDSGNMIVSAEVVKAYGLDAAGYRLVPGTIAEFHGNYARAVAARQWFVMPLWWPHYINKVGNMRELDEPKRLLGEPSNATLVASKAWVARAPADTVRVLRRMHLGLDAVADMDYRVNVDGMAPRDSARQWMQRNAATVQEWFRAE